MLKLVLHCHACDSSPQLVVRAQPPSDAELLSAAVWRAGLHARARMERWKHVADAFGLGRESARSLCHRFNVDPDVITGGRATASDDGA